jgi:hypothetical protein
LSWLAAVQALVMEIQPLETVVAVLVACLLLLDTA